MFWIYSPINLQYIYIYMDVEKKHHVLWVNRTEASLPVRNEDTMYL